ncbi:MAG: hypothetical protein HC860_07940 [Alkalinema sp. RU_4_3]|nr:hypothetical protein [Alkalinema sp. RU_4_3]
MSKRSTLVALTLVGAIALPAQATAPREITNILDFAVPLPGEAKVGGCAFPAVAICSPSDVAKVNTDPNRPLPLIENDTDYDITGFTYQLRADNPIDAVWGPNYSSNLFKKIELSSDRKTLTFSDGLLKQGEFVKATRLGGDAQIAYNVSFQGVKRSVPEASMGVFSLAIVGSGLLLKRKLG